MNPLGVAVLVALAVLFWPARRPQPAWRLRSGSRGEGLWGSLARGVRGSRQVGHHHLVPEALELIAVALSGGGSPAAACASVGSVLPGQDGARLIGVGEALQRGEDAGSAWAEAGEKWAPARHCLELAATAGVAPGLALQQAADDLRRDAVSRVEVAAARLGVRLVLPLGLLFLPAFVFTTLIPVVLALLRRLIW